MKVTDSQLRWMRAIHDFYQKDGWYPGVDDLMKVMGFTSSNSASEMVARLQDHGLADWPWADDEHARRRSKGLHRRANSIRLTPLGASVLKENQDRMFSLVSVGTEAKIGECSDTRKIYTRR